MRLNITYLIERTYNVLVDLYIVVDVLQISINCNPLRESQVKY